MIDTGIDPHHPALASHLWVNPGEAGGSKEDNGIDDDGNGYVDDVHGWNFAADNADLSDRDGHGTHVAGIIATQSPFLIMPLTYLSPGQKRSPIQATSEAILYAVAMGARIINYSSGGYRTDDTELAALKSAQQAGILVVAAAGNQGRNTDRRGYFPADYPLSNILSVGASDRHRRLLAFSNFGPRSVDIVAPGKNIFSTLPGGKYGPMSGTSQATAIVTRQAAYSLLDDPNLDDPEQIIRALLAKGFRDPRLAEKIRYSTGLTAATELQLLAGNIETSSLRDISSTDIIKKSLVNG